MNQLKIVLLIACCLLMMSGCGQKRIIGSVAPGEAQSGSAGQSSDSYRTEGIAGKSAPVQETDLRPPSLQPFEQANMVTPDLGRFMPSVEYVTNRISEYNKKMDRWKKRDSQIAVLRIPADESGKMVACFQDLQKVLNGYNRLYETLLQQASMSPGGPISAKEIYELQQSDIAFLDGGCGQLVAADELRDAGWMKGEDSAALNSVEAVIAQHAANGKFEELVQVWKHMPREMSARMQLNTKILYGSALMSLQQEEEAAQVFRQIVDQMTIPGGQPLNLLALRKTLADLYVASGKYQDAEAQYLEISKEYRNMAATEEWAILQRSILERGEQGGPELQEYSDLLKNYLGFDPSRDGYTVVWQADKFLQTYPYSPVASNVDLIRTAARAQADKWSKQGLTTTDDFAGQKRYQDSAGKLEAVPSTIVSPKAQRQITQKSGGLVPVEKQENETVKLANIEELDRQWNEGMRLMDGAQYDKAIEIFSPMLETEYSEKADKKIAEASLLAAEAQRRNAADMFIRFTKASDVESKKKLLSESRRLLQDILVKYPQVEIADKVRGNIKRVEKEMNAIDPDLVRQSGGVGQEQKAMALPAAAATETGGSFPPGGQAPMLK